MIGQVFVGGDYNLLYDAKEIIYLVSIIAPVEIQSSFGIELNSAHTLQIDLGGTVYE